MPRAAKLGKRICIYRGNETPQGKWCARRAANCLPGRSVSTADLERALEAVRSTPLYEFLGFHLKAAVVKRQRSSRVAVPHVVPSVELLPYCDITFNGCHLKLRIKEINVFGCISEIGAPYIQP